MSSSPGGGLFVDFPIVAKGMCLCRVTWYLRVPFALALETHIFWTNCLYYVWGYTESFQMSFKKLVDPDNGQHIKPG